MRNIHILFLIALSLIVGVSANASKLTTDTRIDLAEKVMLTVPYNVSDTIKASENYGVVSPVKGNIIGMYFTYLGPTAITTGTSANIVAKIGGVSVTTISITVPSGTVALGTISSSVVVNPSLAQPSSTLVSKGQLIELNDTGSPVMSGAVGGSGFMTLEIMPNYY